MPTQVEELQLRVTLDDEASAKLRAIKTSAESLSTGATATRVRERRECHTVEIENCASAATTISSSTTSM
jgi:hypothetical protein